MKRIDDLILNRPKTFFLAYSALLASLGASFEFGLLPIAIGLWTAFGILLAIRKK